MPWLAIAGLWTLAVAQPLFDLIARSPEFLVAHRASRADILALAATLVLAGPVVLVGIVWLAGRAGRRARAVAAGIAIAGLIALVAMQLAARSGIAAWTLAAAIACVAGALAAIAHARLRAVRLFASLLGLAMVLAPVVFLTRPGVRRAMAADTGVGRARVVRTAPPAGTPTSAPVVMLVLDETPLLSFLDADRRIDAGLYPNFAALARDGTWYRNATTNSDYTQWAVPAIMSGRYPDPERLPTAADYPDNLFTLLGRTHRLEVNEVITHLCPSELCGGENLSQWERAVAIGSDLGILYLHVLATPDVRPALPDLTSGWAGFGRPETRDERRRRQAQHILRGRRLDNRGPVRAFIQRISPRDPQPTFYFMHTLLSHFPQLDLPSGQRNATLAAVPAEIRGAMMWTRDEWAVLQTYQRHLMQMESVDAVIGQLLQRLKDAGLYDRSLIVVTSDHGSSFQPGTRRRDFTDVNAPEIMRIPLVIKFPAGVSPTGQVSDRNVETIDIAPTIADALGLTLPWKPDGGALLQPSAPERRTKTIFYSAARQSRTYGPEGPDVTALLGRKIEIFGGAENPYRVPRPPRFAELVGRPVSELRIEDGGARVEVRRASRFRNMKLKVDPVAFDVAGRVELPAPRGEPTYVAVAVNGTIRAVTRTWDTDPSGWLATPPLDSWREGKNTLEVFVVEEDDRGPLLRRPRSE